MEPPAQHAVLALQALGDRERRDAERGETLVRELDVDAFCACLPKTSTFLTIGTLSRRRLMSSAMSDSSAWPMPSPLTAYSRPYTSPNSSLKIGPTTPSGSSSLMSLNFLRAWYQASRWSALRGAAAHGDRHAAVALAREGHDLLEVVDLLELLLHAVEHLVLHLLRRGARPDHHGRHRRHGEVRVFELAELA